MVTLVAAGAAVVALMLRKHRDPAECALDRLSGIIEEHLLSLPKDEATGIIRSIGDSAASHTHEQHSKIPSLL